MSITNKPLFFLLLLGLFCSNRVFSQECRKDTVYLVFDSSKFAEREYIYLFFGPEGLYTRYIDDKNSKNIIFERMHKSANNVYDTFIFDGKKYTPKKVLKKDLNALNIKDYDELETALDKEKKYEEPGIVFPNFGIIEVRGQTATIYSPIKWERVVNCE